MKYNLQDSYATAGVWRGTRLWKPALMWLEMVMRPNGPTHRRPGTTENVDSTESASLSLVSAVYVLKKCERMPYCEWTHPSHDQPHTQPNCWQPTWGTHQIVDERHEQAGGGCLQFGAPFQAGTQWRRGERFPLHTPCSIHIHEATGQGAPVRYSYFLTSENQNTAGQFWNTV